MAGLRHGTWWDKQRGVPLDKIMEGRFTRLFPDIDGAQFPDDDLRMLADAMTSPVDSPPTSELKDDAEENPAIEAAYTYLGQFVDHDLTFDQTSHLREFLTPDQLKNLVDFRTPRFDLDNLYGRGPDDQPYMYAADGVHMLLGAPMSGNPHDTGTVQVPRGPNGRALIGDPRNDENRIVSQLQSTMLRFHNKVACFLTDKDPHTSFQDVRQQVRWHYQWVLVNDFLPTVINQETINRIFPDPYQPQLSIPKLQDGLKLMPVEFSVAAYRFGHSMIRPIYRLNQTIQRRPIFSTGTDDGADLGGFRPIPSDWGIDWQSFIDLEHGVPIPPVPDDPNDEIARKSQHAYKIDTAIVNPLGLLPPAVAANPPSLILRNLERGATFQLPSGQSVAKALGVPAIPDDKLLIGKATGDKVADPKIPIADIAPGFAGNAPLWTYVLAEAHQTSWDAAPPSTDEDTIPIRLGPVGGTLVGEVFAAILVSDRTSYLYSQPGFSPIPEFTHDGAFGLAELINVALGRNP
ncbi:MAG: heme peroxidase family protein [Pseudonocardiaceae bacterium]